MSEAKKPATPRSASAAKQERLAAALRENLKRRKTQARAQTSSKPNVDKPELLEKAHESKEN